MSIINQKRAILEKLLIYLFLLLWLKNDKVVVKISLSFGKFH